MGKTVFMDSDLVKLDSNVKEVTLYLKSVLDQFTHPMQNKKKRIV